MSFLTFTTLPSIHSRENKRTEGSSFFLRILGSQLLFLSLKRMMVHFLSHYKQMCSSFDINQLLPPSPSHFPLLLHGFVLKQCTSFLSLLPNYQQEPSQGNALHKPTLKRKEKNPTKTTSSNSKQQKCGLAAHLEYLPTEKIQLLSWRHCWLLVSLASGWPIQGHSSCLHVLPQLPLSLVGLKSFSFCFLLHPPHHVHALDSFFLHWDLSHVGSCCGFPVDAPCDSNVCLPEVL